MKVVSASIEIEASPLDVWAVLVDLDRYPEWNPLFREASGRVAVGNRITLKSVPPGGRPMTVRPKIVSAEPGVELRWAASLPGLIGGEHTFALSPAGGGTRVVQSESFRGLLVPFSSNAIARAEAGFLSVNEALRKRVEAVAR